MLGILFFGTDVTDKSKVEISHKFVAFSEYMNFKAHCLGCRAAILDAFSIHFRGTGGGKYSKVIGLSHHLNKMSAYFIFKAYALRSTVASIHPAILDAFSIFRSTAGGGKYLKSNSVD